MAKYNILWDSKETPQAKTPEPSVTLSNRTIRINDVPELSKADKIMLGYDKDQKVIAIKECTEENETVISYDYAAKLKEGSATIHCQKFLESAYRALTINLEPKQRIKCGALYDAKMKVLFAKIPQDN